MNRTVHILSMNPGPELDAEIASAMTAISGDDHTAEPFTTDPAAAIRLWQFAAMAFGTVALVALGDAPKPWRQFCAIHAEDDPAQQVDILTGCWMESLGKAFLLMHLELYGAYGLLDGQEQRQGHLH